MLINNKKRLAAAVLILGIISTGMGVQRYQYSLESLRKNIENTFLARSQLLGRFVSLHQQQVMVMRNLLVEHYRSPDKTPLALQQHSQLGVWQLPSSDGKPLGSLTGAGQLPPSPELQQEIRAALALDSQIAASLKLNNEAAWLYYQSASQFIYLAPGTPLEQFRFTPQLYQYDYWTENTPQVNPERRLIMDGPYQDMAGKGWIFTFAQPVYDGDHFLGVVALDIAIDTLKQLSGIGEAPGETLLVSENGHLIARQGAFEPGALLTPPMSEDIFDWRKDKQGNRWLSYPLVKDELWVLHRIEPGQLERAAIRESLLSWALIGLIALLCLFAWRLMGALIQLTRMTHTDPLTMALNRRGFYDKASELLALAKRKQLPIAVLLMDIDFFKKINDSHGHAAGDQVLRQLGGHLLKARRSFDLVCRWGGEEFVVLLLLDQEVQALGVAERLRQQAQQTRIPDSDQAVTLSGGLVLLGPDEDLDQAVKRADELLYKAKQKGRNHIEH